MAIVHAANVADGAVLAATADRAGGRAYNLANDFDVCVRDFYRLAGVGMGRRIRLLPVPRMAAEGLFSVGLFVLKLLTAGRLSVVSSGSLDFLVRDNPFNSDRARLELGWSPSVRPEDGLPDAFRSWREGARGSSANEKGAA